MCTTCGEILGNVFMRMPRVKFGVSRNGSFLLLTAAAFSDVVVMWKLGAWIRAGCFSSFFCGYTVETKVTRVAHLVSL